jgi:hypothetical protein
MELAVVLIVSFIITWTIGLIPPVLIRYVFLKQPMAKKLAIVISAVFWLLNLILFISMGSGIKSHFALMIVAYVSYYILTREKKGSMSQRNLATTMRTKPTEPIEP